MGMRKSNKSDLLLENGMTEVHMASAVERRQWHAPYYCSMRMELRANGEGFSYEEEHLLNTKPLQLDMLVWAEDGVTWVLDEITAGFRRHNIIEFKSPDDMLNLDVFYKGIGYGCLYKAQGKKINEIIREEVTLTFIRESKPERLLQQLSNLYKIVERDPGVYELKGDIIQKLLFPVQILVLKEMNWRKHIWLTALKRHITSEHAKMLLLEMQRIRDAAEWEWADSVLQLVVANNEEIFEELKGEKDMCQAFRELMSKEIHEELYKAECRGEARGEKRGERRGEKRGEEIGRKQGAKTFGEIIKRLLDGEDVEKLRNAGINEELLMMAVGILQR